MTTATTVFTADGTFTAPADLIGGSVQVVVYGQSAGGGNGAVVTATIPMAPAQTLQCYAGDYHLAGLTGASAKAGGSSAVVTGGVLQVEAGGGGGIGLETPGAGFSPGGGGFGGNPAATGENNFFIDFFGEPYIGGGGGANGSTPGIAGGGNVGTGQAGSFGGAPGTANGGAGAGSGFGGGGGGGYAGGGGGGYDQTDATHFTGSGGGGGSCFALGTLSGVSIANGTSASATGQVTVNYVTADAPLAPTLLAPGNAGFAELNTPGPTFQFTYNPGPNSGSIGAWTMRRKTTGAYNYWTATGSLGSPGGNWTSTTPVWNAATFLSVDPLTDTCSYVFPAGAWTDGTTYNWSVATEESGFGLQGPFATDFTVNAQVGPVLNVTPLPAASSTATPIVEWTETLAGGTSQVSFRVVYYTGAQLAVPGFTPGVSPATFDSGVVASAALLYATPVIAGLENGISYVVYVQIVQSGPQASAWENTTTTIIFNGPAAPMLAAMASNDSTTNQPFVALTALFNQNQLSAIDSTFESGTGSNVPVTNCTLSTITTEALDGDQALQLSSVAAGAMAAGCGNTIYPVTPGAAFSAMASLRAMASGRSCRIGIFWYQTGGAPSAIKASSLGAAANDVTTAWTLYTASDNAPADAATAQIQYLVAGTGGAAEKHAVDEVGLFNGITPPAVWSMGGFFNDAAATAEFQYSDDGGVTWADLRFGAAQPINAAQTATCLDYESPPVVEASS